MKDKYTILAKRKGLRARSVFKLFQINKKYKLIKKGDDVLDLGCWPGGWLKAAKQISKTGKIVGVDLKKIKPIEGVDFIQGDINEIKVQGKFDVVLSDMAPKTSGIVGLDVERSLDLANIALEKAAEHLKKNGNFIVKVFQGKDFAVYLNKVKKQFKFAKTTKPLTSRKRSKEVYVIGVKKV
ncbi:MAG: RlmE family RNA methyltransferase [Nanoarchaeota archaeon]|nr:RlmE family RNA methyltransferase [Nanoarchaeota archaeon]